MRTLVTSTLLALSLSTLNACDGIESLDAPSTAESAIVNGQTETGYPHIGALTLWYGNNYYGSFCTGTLIASKWVLTAAHCFDDGTTANQVRFFIGNNANNPNSGRFYRANRLIPHERYNSNTLVNDIGLIELSEAVPSSVAQPMPYATTSLANVAGRTAFYVGFGRITGLDVANDGSGVKRSTSFPITSVNSQFLVSNYAGTSTCQGDSGGPALLDISNVSTIVSVTSHGIDCTVYDPGCDVCKTTSYATRLDVHAPWVAGYLNGTNTGGGTTPGSNLNCEAIYDCMVDCSTESCQNSCYNSGSSTGQTQINNLLTCLNNYCSNASTDAAFQTCASNYCSSQINTCFSGSTGSTTPTYTTCDSLYGCLVDCSTESCQNSCYSNSSQTAQSQVNTLVSCMNTQCGNINDETAFTQCVYNKCTAPIETCFYPEDSRCDLMAGECGRGAACYPATDNVNACFESQDRPNYGSCSLTAETLTCRDGFACVTNKDGVSGTCLPFCTNDQHCRAGDYCDFSVTEGLIASHGICLTAEDSGGGNTDGGGSDDGGGSTDGGGSDDGGGSTDGGGPDNGGGNTDGGGSGTPDSNTGSGGSTGGGTQGAGSDSGGCEGAGSPGLLGGLASLAALGLRRRRR